MINVVAAIIKKNDHFLIVQRNRKKHLGLKWEFPGGKVMESETFEEALLREIKEELKDNKIDIVFEHVGANTWNDSLRLFAKGGRIVTCGATTGASVQINLAHLFMTQQSILGSTMSSIESFNEVMKLIENKIFFPFSMDS